MPTIIRKPEHARRRRQAYDLGATAGAEYRLQQKLGGPAARAMGSLALVGIPTALLLDRQGREIGRRTGPAPWDAPEAVRMIAGYMDSGAKP